MPARPPAPRFGAHALPAPHADGVGNIPTHLSGFMNALRADVDALLGAPAPGAPTARWLGTVGSTSDHINTNLWRGFGSIRSLALAATKARAAAGYGEGYASDFTFSPATPQQPVAGDVKITNVLLHTCTDGTLFYTAGNGSGWDYNHSTFIVANRVSNDAHYAFPNGKALVFSRADVPGYAGVLGLTQATHQNAAGQPDFYPPAYEADWFTGLAVQTNGVLLAAARAGRDRVEFFHKTSGAAVGTLAVGAPGACCFAPNGQLWVCTGGTVKTYANRGSDAAVNFQPVSTLAGLANALAVAASPVADVLLVVDGGPSQQVKAFTAAGAPLRTFGRAGGNAANPDFAVDRFHFRNRDVLDQITGQPRDRPAYNAEAAFVTFAPDGSFWLGDRGNHRVLHFSATYAYREQISYFADVQHACVDRANPTRLFIEGIEYALDLSRPLQRGDQSRLAHPTCRAVKNWAAALPDTYDALLNVVTLRARNGTRRTYAQWQVAGTNERPHTELVELPAAGAARRGGGLLDARENNNEWLYEATGPYPGGVRQWNVDYNDARGIRQVGVRRDFTQAFDGNGWPIFAAPKAVVDFIANPPYAAAGHTNPVATSGWGQKSRAPLLPNGQWVSYLTAVSSTKQAASQGRIGQAKRAFHLGAVAPGARNWAWKALPGTVTPGPAQPGTFPENVEANQLGNQPTTGYGGHCGVAVDALDGYVFSCFDGQFGRPSNQFYVHDQAGRLVLQGGRTHDQSPDFTNPNAAPLGYASNTAMMQAFKTGGKYYLLTTDEANYGGVHLHEILLPSRSAH